MTTMLSEDKTILKKIGNRIRQLRGDRTLTNIAEKAHTYPANIQKIERGDHMPSYGLLRRISQALGCKISELDPEA
jgi:transcriptional regulator with XRE-family HTH domain